MTNSSCNGGVLLTGATGFLGSALLRELVKSGRQVYATVRPQSKLDAVEALMGSPNLHFISHEPEALEAEFARQSIGAIVHAATQYGRDGIGAADILNANLILPVRLAELGIKYGSKAFINIDTFLNKFHSSNSHLVSYSRSKRMLLDWLEVFSTNINVANAVLEHMYGPGDSNSKFVETMVQSIAVDQVESVDLTYGHQHRDFIYVSDVVSAILTILSHVEAKPLPFSTIEIGTGESIQVRDMVSLISSLSGSRTELRFGAIPYRFSEIMGSYADTNALFKLGWRPNVTPAEGVAMILDHYDVRERP